MKDTGGSEPRRQRTNGPRRMHNVNLLKWELRLLDLICGRRIDRQARERLAEVARAQIRASRARATALLATLGREPGPHVLLGETFSQELVRVPLEYLIKAHA